MAANSAQLPKPCPKNRSAPSGRYQNIRRPAVEVRPLIYKAPATPIALAPVVENRLGTFPNPSLPSAQHTSKTARVQSLIKESTELVLEQVIASQRSTQKVLEDSFGSITPRINNLETTRVATEAILKKIIDNQGGILEYLSAIKEMLISYSGEIQELQQVTGIRAPRPQQASAYVEEQHFEDDQCGPTQYGEGSSDFSD